MLKEGGGELSPPGPPAARPPLQASMEGGDAADIARTLRTLRLDRLKVGSMGH